MALLDVSDNCYDPDFASTFQVLRTTQTVSSGGIAADGAPQTFTAIGSVQPDRGRAMQRLAEGERNNDAIKIYTQFGLIAGVGNIEADQVQWNGGTYVVVNVRDWRAFGAGYVEAVCDLTDINVATDPLGSGSGTVQPLPVVSDVALITSGATESTPYQVLKTDLSIYVDKTVGTPTFIALPASPSLDEQHLVKDAKGDAGQNPITVSASCTIDGQATATLVIGHEALIFKFNGSEWSII